MVFATMIAVLFADPSLAKTAEYLPKGGLGGKAVRVIAKQPDTLTSFGEARIHSSTTLFDVQASEILHPQVGDQLTVGGIAYVIQSEPMADSERLVWTLDVVPL